MKIGYAITTTPKRYDPERDYFEMCEKDAVCYLHNDREGIGVAVAKNRCIKALYNMGCDYIILMDDDTRILRPGFGQWLEVVHRQTGIHHFIYPGKGASVCRCADGLVQWSLGSGVMLFITRGVVGKVGYMNVNYPGKWGHEHVAWSVRIWKAGLMGDFATWRVSPVAIKDYFWSADIDGTPMAENYTEAEKRYFKSVNMPEYIRETQSEQLYYPIKEEVSA